MKVSVRERLGLTAGINGLLFVGLNVADVWLTKQLLDLGSREGNPIVVPYGDNILIKAFLALAIVLLLVRFGKARLLWILNICMLAIVLWNGTWLLLLS